MAKRLKSELSRDPQQVPFYHQQPLLHRPSARHQQPNGDHSQRDGPHFVQQNPSRDNDHFVGHSQSSGYSSTEVTGGSAASSRDSKLPLPQPDKSPPTRDSWVSLSDQASHIHYYSYCTVYQTGLSSQQTEMARHDGSTFFPSPGVGSGGEMRRAGTEGCLHFPLRENTNTISPGNQKVLESHMPELLEGIDPLALLPYLHSLQIVSGDDSDYIRNPSRTTLERNMRIVYSSPRKDARAFSRFITALEKAEHHPRHVELAQLLRDGVIEQRKSTFAKRSERSARLLRNKYSHFRSTPNLKVSGYDAESDTTSIDQQAKACSRLERSHDHESRSRLQLSPSSSGDEASVIGTSDRRSATTKASKRLSPADSEADQPDGSLFCLLEEKFKWLQECVKFKSCREEILFTSKTSYQTSRDILHFGVILLNGKSRVLVLCSDLLLILEPVKSISWEGMESQAGTREPANYEWFSQQRYTARMPLLLHLMEVRCHTKDTCSFSLRYQPNDLEMTLAVCTETARNVWIRVFECAIKQSKKERKKCILPMWIENTEKPSGVPFWKITLTVMEANSLRLPHTADNYHLFCTVGLRHKRVYRTPTTVGKGQAKWNYSFSFTEFATNDVIEIGLLQENLFRPNEFIGCVTIQVSEIPLTLREEEKAFNLKQGKHISGKLKVSLGVNREINV